MSLTPRIRRLVRRTVWSGAALTFLASSVTQVIFPALSIATIDTSGIAGGFDKETLGVGRLLLGVLWFWALYGFIRIHERRIDQLTRGMLVTLGTKLLYVYGIHGCVIFILTLTLTPPSQPPILMSTLFAASVIGLIYVIAVSPTIARYLDYQYHAYRVQTLLGYNRSYESS